MPSYLSWDWSDAAYYRALLDAARVNRRNVLVYLPSDPADIMVAIVSHRLFRFQREPLDFTKPELQSAVARACEDLMTVYAGVDVETTVLADYISARIRVEGGTITFRTAVVWDSGTFGLFSPAEFDLSEEFYVEKQLLMTELRHRGELLEE